MRGVGAGPVVLTPFFRQQRHTSTLPLSYLPSMTGQQGQNQLTLARQSLAPVVATIGPHERNS